MKISKKLNREAIGEDSSSIEIYKSKDNGVLYYKNTKNELIKIEQDIIFSTLPNVGETGKLYFNDADLYYWNGTENVKLNVENTPINIVYFDQLTPTTGGVVFTPVTPATENTLYISSVDNSEWTYYTSAYHTYSGAPVRTATTEQVFINALGISPAPLDTMMVQVTDPASTTVKKFSWANLKVYLLSYFDTVYPRKTVASTGSVISFEVSVVWNTFGTPSTANLTNDLTNAKIGYIQKIYHNKAVEPTYPAEWVKMGTGTYTNGVLNVIFAEWVSGTRVEYWIVKPA